MTIADVITAISVAIAAIAFVVGVNAWRREFIGKRRIELAENVLALFYEAEDAIREIRSPFILAGEGTSRKRSDHETEEETRILDQAYVVFERYQKREKLFAELKSMKYRAMATFGSEAGESFEELTLIIDEIFSAAAILGSYYWKGKRRARLSKEKLEKHWENMIKYEDVIWSMNEHDEITPKVQRAVKRMEAIARKEVMIKTSWFRKSQKDDPKSKSRA
jgi:hypothetical protein